MLVIFFSKIVSFNVSERWKLSFPGGSMVKNPPANGGDAGLTVGQGSSPGEENGNPLQ